MSRFEKSNDAVSNQRIKRAMAKGDMPRVVGDWVAKVKSSFAAMKQRGVDNPNIGHEPVTQLFEMLGFKDIGREVFEAFD